MKLLVRTQFCVHSINIQEMMTENRKIIFLQVQPQRYFFKFIKMMFLLANRTSKAGPVVRVESLMCLVILNYDLS